MELPSSCNGHNGNNQNWRAEDVIVGNKEVLEYLREYITWPYLHFREAQQLGLKFPKGVIIHGPTGTGKKSMVRAVVRECGGHLTFISQKSLVDAKDGKRESLRQGFYEASTHAMTGKPSVILIEELDAPFLPESGRGQQVRLAGQLIRLMNSSHQRVLVVASAIRVHMINRTLRKLGRFDTEIEVTASNKEDRYNILKLCTKKVPLDPGIDLRDIASSCNGYVGADLGLLCREAVLNAIESSNAKDAGVISITMEDWKHALSQVPPSLSKVGIPEVTWDDIGGYKELKKRLQQAVEWPIKYYSAFSRLGIPPLRGILLHGPPGCAKTTLAMATARAAQASFFSLSAADLYSKFVGEGEALLRNTFQKARVAAPSIIFFDEVDTVAPKRGRSSSSNVEVGERLVSTLLTEMDGLEEAKGVLVLAATNRVNAIDTALLRPGRFDLVLYVPPPDLQARYEILRVHSRRMPLGDGVDLWKIAEDTELFTGDELRHLCQEAVIVALRENMNATAIYHHHFQRVKDSMKPDLTKEDIDFYSSFAKRSSTMASGPSTFNVEHNKT